MPRNFKEKPVTQNEIIYSRWYPVVDDTIGGWSISNVDESVAFHNPAEGRFELGSFLTEDQARHIAWLHNCWWDTVVAASYMDNLGAMFITYANHAELTRSY